MMSSDRLRIGPRWVARCFVFFCVPFLLTVVGCPRRFDPRAQELHSKNPAAEQDFQAAQRLVEGGDPKGAEAALRHFTETYPGDPRQDQARYLLGVFAHRQGNWQKARALLTPFAGTIIEGPEATELFLILADVEIRAGAPKEALRFFERAYVGVGITPIEKAYIRSQVQRLLPSLPSQASAVELRKRFDLPYAPEGITPGVEPDKETPIGLVLPLRGRERPLGDRILRGALFAAGIYGGDGPAGVDLRIREIGETPEEAAQAVRELASEGVVALVGSPGRGPSVGRVFAEAEQHGIPVLDVSPGAGDGGRKGAVFSLVQRNPQRIRALIDQGLSRGKRSFAVLAADTPYGKAMTEAVQTALVGKSGKLVASLRFAEGSTTFKDQAAQLAALAPDAIVLPVASNQLELISAQLATLGVIPTQDVNVPRAAKAKGGALVLSTADGMGQRLLRNAGRYLQGAVLAPLSISAVRCDDTAMTTIAERFTQKVGEEIGALDSLGHDAIQLIRLACGKTSPCSASQVAKSLLTLRTVGATGTLSFDESGQRAGLPLLLSVEGNEVRVVRPLSSTGPTSVQPGHPSGG